MISELRGLKNFIDSPQKLFSPPWPINKSLNKKPANIAPAESIIRGKSIINGDSCISLIFNFFDYYSSHEMF